MKRRGFTLIETLMGLFLLGLVSVTILPIINTSLMRLTNLGIRMDMVHKGESLIEAIKAYNAEATEELIVCGVPISHIITAISSDETAEMKFSSQDDGEKFNIHIMKTQRSEDLWIVDIAIDENKIGSKISNVEFKAFIPSQ